MELEVGANVKLRGCGGFLIPCDANVNFLMLEVQTIFEYDISSFLGDNLFSLKVTLFE